MQFLEMDTRHVATFRHLDPVHLKKIFFEKFDILLPKLLRPTVRKNCSGDREKLLKFEIEIRDFSNLLRSLEQFIQTVKIQNNFW